MENKTTFLDGLLYYIGKMKRPVNREEIQSQEGRKVIAKRWNHYFASSNYLHERLTRLVKKGKLVRLHVGGCYVYDDPKNYQCIPKEIQVEDKETAQVIGDMLEENGSPQTTTTAARKARRIQGF